MAFEQEVTELVGDREPSSGRAPRAVGDDPALAAGDIGQQHSLETGRLGRVHFHDIEREGELDHRDRALRPAEQAVDRPGEAFGLLRLVGQVDAERGQD